MDKFIEDLKYLKYTIFHPFDAFYEIKWRAKGSLTIAIALIIIYGITAVLGQQYTGFIVNQVMPEYINSIMTFALSIAPLLLLGVSNWSVATLYNGKGKIKDLYTVIGYASLPYIIFSITTIILSNIVIREEISILLAFQSTGLFWTYFLIFCGFTTVHEYTVKESVITFIMTAIAAIVIVFITVLYFSLMEQFVNFLLSIGQEITKRW